MIWGYHYFRKHPNISILWDPSWVLLLCSVDDSRFQKHQVALDQMGMWLSIAKAERGAVFPQGEGVEVPFVFFWQFTPRKISGWNIIMEVWKIIFLSKWVICRFHVNLPGCSLFTFNQADACNRLRLWPFCHHTFGPVELCFTSCCCGWFGWYWSGSKEVTWTAIKKKRCSG